MTLINDYEALRWVYRVLLFAAAISSWGVVFTYHFRSHGQWRKSEWGRHLIGSDTVLAVTLTFYICASFIPDRRWVYTLGIILFLGFIWYRVNRSRLMLKSQREGEARVAAEQARHDREDNTP